MATFEGPTKDTTQTTATFEGPSTPTGDDPFAGPPIKADHLGRTKARYVPQEKPEGIDKLREDMSAFGQDVKAGFKAAVEGIPGAAGAVVGAEGGLALGAMTSPVTGPVGPIVGAISGAIIGGYTGAKTGETLKNLIPESTLKQAGFTRGEREVEKTQHPKASFAGELASSLPFFGPGKVKAIERAFGAIVGGGMETGTELYHGGPLDPVKIGEAATFQGVFAKPTAITKAISNMFGNTARLSNVELGKDSVAADTAKRDSTIQTTIDKFDAEAKADEASKTKTTTKSSDKILSDAELLVKFKAEHDANEANRKTGKADKPTYDDWLASKRAENANVSDPDKVARHPLEQHTNYEVNDPARSAAADAGIRVVFTDNTGLNGRIDPRKTTVDWNVLDKFTSYTDVLNHIKDHLPLDLKAFVDRFEPFVQDVTFQTKDKITDGKAAGLYTRNIKTGDSQIALGKNWEHGNSFETIVHEGLHSATNKNYVEGLKDPSNPFHGAAKQLTQLFYDIKYNQDASRRLKKAGHSFSDNSPEELLTWGLTNSKTKEILNSIKFEGKETGWTRFVRNVLNLVGVSPDKSTAYTQLVGIADRLISGSEAKDTPHRKYDPKFDLPFNEAEAKARYKSEMYQEDIAAGHHGTQTELDREIAKLRDTHPPDEFTYEQLSPKEREDLARKLYHYTDPELLGGSKEDRVRAFLEDTEAAIKHDQPKTKLDREKEAWANENKGRTAKVPYKPKDTAEHKVSTSEPGEQRKIGTEKKTKGPKDEALIHEANARKLYHTQGPEAAVAYLEQVTPLSSKVVEDIKDRIGVNLNNVDANQRLANIFKDELIRLVPDEAERSALPAAIEHGLPLEGPAATAAEKYKEKMFEIGQQAEKVDVIRGLVTNYVTRMARKAGITEAEESGFINSILHAPGVQEGLKAGSKYGKERTAATIEQARQAMLAKGIEMESDLATIAHNYMTDMYKAIEDKKLFNELKVTKIDDKYAVVDSKSKEDHYGYKMIEHGPYAGWFVHPDIKPALNFVLGASELGPWMKSAIALNTAIKRSNISASLFHAKSLAEAYVTARPYLGKEAGNHSISSVLKILRQGGMSDMADFAIREGGVKLGMSSVEDVSHSALEELGKVGDRLLGAYSDKKILQSALGKAEKATLGKIDKFTWDFVHDGLKLLTFSKLLDQAVHDHPNVPKAIHAKEIGRFVNNSFGGLNWYDIARQSSSKFEESMKMAAYSPNGRRALQLVLFAPDWTVSTLRSFTTALPKSLLAPDVVGGIKGLMKPKTQGDFARLYQMKFALTYLTLLNGVNMLTSGHPIWDNKDPTRLEFRDKTTMQATKHAMEFIHFIKDSDKFIADKLGFLPKAAIVAITGLEYASPAAAKLEDPSWAGRGKAIAKTALPFWVQAAQGAPKGEAIKRTLLGMAGLPVYGKTDAQKAAETHEKNQRKYERKIKEAQDNE